MASLSSKIKAHLGREVNFRTEVMLEDIADGKGPFIAQWNAPEPRPSEAELDAAESIADAVDEAQLVLDARKVAYGGIGDQLDMIYWDQVNDTTVWFDHVAKVKADNPK